MSGASPSRKPCTTLHQDHRPFQCRVGQARFERRPTIQKPREILVGLRGEAPLVPPYDFRGTNKAMVLVGQSATVDLIQPAHESRPIHRVQAARKSRLANGFHVAMPRRCYAVGKVAHDFDG